MADDNKVLFELGLDRAAWNQDAAAILSSAGDIDAALQGVIAQAGSVGRALGSIGNIAVKVDVDIADLAAAETLIADLGNTPPVVKVGSDATALRTTEGLIEDIDAAAPSVDVNATDSDLKTAQGIVEDIDAAAPSVDVTVTDTELKAAQGIVADIDGESASVKVEVDDSGASSSLDNIQGQLEDLKKLAVIDLVMQASGPALGILQQALNLVTSTDEAVRTLAARTGQEIPGAAQIIDDLYTSNWGESKQQIAETLALASQLGVEQENLGAAVESAFQVASVTGEDVNEILRTQNQIVKTDLAGSYQEAADILTTGFQTGANRGDDLLDTFNEYSAKFREFGLTGEEALAIINAGLNNGFENSDKVADIMNELYIRITDVGDAAAQSALNELGINIDPSTIMEGGMGTQILQQVIDGVQAASGDRQQELTRALFGTIAEDKGLYAVMGLEDYSAVEASFDTIDGRAQQSADIINDTLGGALNTLFRNVEVEAQRFLSSDQINLDQKIEDIKNGITSTLEALGNGEDLAGALEIGLAIPGFADSVHRFEASIGEFAIGVLELIAGVQDFLGKDSSGTRSQIANMAEAQLAYNLKVANPDEFAGEIQRATDRGVSDANITQSVGTAIAELIDQGDIERAQSLVDNLQNVSYALQETGGGLRGLEAERILQAIDTGTATQEAIQSAVDRGLITEIKADIDTEYLQSQIDTAAQQMQDEFNARMAEMAQGSGAAFDPGSEFAVDVNPLQEQFATIQTLWGGARTSVETDAEAIATATENADQRVAMALTGNTMTTSFEEVGRTADSVFPQAAEVVGGSVERMVTAEQAMTSQTNILKGAMLALLGEVGPGFLDLAMNLQNIASGATIAAQTIGAATAASAAATGGIPEFASGGQASGLFSAGENGRELIFADEQVAVLNNQSTEALVNAVRSVAGYAGIPTGGGGGQINMVNNWYVPSVAVGTSISQQMAASIRGQGG